MRQRLIEWWRSLQRAYWRGRRLATRHRGEVASEAMDAASVDQALQVIEAQEGGAVHPIRAVPLDVIAGALVHEMRETGATSGAALSAIVRRYAPPRVHVEQGSMFP